MTTNREDKKYFGKVCWPWSDTMIAPLKRRAAQSWKGSSSDRRVWKVFPPLGLCKGARLGPFSQTLSLTRNESRRQNTQAAGKTHWEEPDIKDIMTEQIQHRAVQMRPTYKNAPWREPRAKICVLIEEKENGDKNLIFINHFLLLAYS